MSAGDDLSIGQSVAFALLYVVEAEGNRDWATWAHAWLKGDDRSVAAAAAAEAVATLPAARHAAAAARLLAEAEALQTEAAMLEAEGRNARWTLDTSEQRHTACLAEIAESLRLSGGESDPRAADLRAQVRRDH